MKRAFDLYVEDVPYVVGAEEAIRIVEQGRVFTSEFRDMDRYGLYDRHETDRWKSKFRDGTYVVISSSKPFIAAIDSNFGDNFFLNSALEFALQRGVHQPTFPTSSCPLEDEGYSENQYTQALAQMTSTPGTNSYSSAPQALSHTTNSDFQICSAPTPSEKGYEQFIESEDQKIKIMEDILNSLGIVTREKWGAQSPKTNLDSDWDYQAIAIHHAGNSFDFNSTINHIQEEHLNKFDDIGYHYAINKDGVIYEGRPITKLGCHILDGNTGNIGIVLIGDLSERGEAEFNINDISTWRDQGDFLSSGTAPKAMYNAALKLSQKLTQVFQNIKTIGGHYEFAALLNQTRYCPGSHGMEVVRSLRQDLNKQKPK